MNDSLAQEQSVALLQKISEQEEELQRLHQEIETLRRQIADHQALIADLNAFSHMVAHDLKNPLTALTGYSFLLTTRLRDTQDTTVLRFLQVIDQTSTRMARIIDALLMLASVRQQKIVPKPLEMGKIIAEVESRLELMAFQYHAQINKPELWPEVLGYGPWIEEVWYNYLSNAIKFGGTPPIIEIGSRPMPDDKICFWVHDNGNGLPAEAMAALFAVSTDDEHPDYIPMEGQGLGLSIVKRIIDRLGGEVSVESANLPGEGCTFSFTLPLAH
jgi:two-component system sensor histidine kinase/response regulator